MAVLRLEMAFLSDSSEFWANLYFSRSGVVQFGEKLKGIP